MEQSPWLYCTLPIPDELPVICTESLAALIWTLPMPEESTVAPRETEPTYTSPIPLFVMSA